MKLKYHRLVVLGDLVDPVPEFSDPGVDTGIVGLAAANAPADHPNLGPCVTAANLHRTARVALKRKVRKSRKLEMSCCGTYTAGVLALLASTQHVVHDAPWGGGSVGVLAHLVVPDTDSDFLQDVGLRPVLLEATPANYSGSPVLVLGSSLLGKAHWPDIGQIGHLVLQGDDSHVLRDGCVGRWSHDDCFTL